MATVVVGDIHGRLDRLESLFEALPVWPDQFVFLGDYIDRGPDSKAVIDRLLALAQEVECVFLRGNHEDMALDVLDQGNHYEPEIWEMNGGLQTIRSYLKDARRGGLPLHGRDAWRASLPPSHAQFLRDTALYHETPDLVFVHARINAEGPQRTPPEVLLWERIESPLLSMGYGKRVICGHTPFPEPMIGPDWINLDTGCGKWEGAVLSALMLPEGRFVSG
jgi:serine/threonine protein phosphatase 1